MRQNLPEFKNENEEIEFWDGHDSTGFIDWSKTEWIILPKLRTSVKRILLRLSESML